MICPVLGISNVFQLSTSSVSLLVSNYTRIYPVLLRDINLSWHLLFYVTAVPRGMGSICMSLVKLKIRFIVHVPTASIQLGDATTRRSPISTITAVVAVHDARARLTALPLSEKWSYLWTAYAEHAGC